MTDNSSIMAHFQDVYLLLGAMMFFNLLVVYWVTKKNEKRKPSVHSGISTSFGSLLLASGAFGIFLTLFRYFTILESSTDSKPGQWELVLPLIASVLVFLTSAAAYWVLRHIRKV